MVLRGGIFDYSYDYLKYHLYLYRQLVVVLFKLLKLFSLGVNLNKI